MVSSALVDKSIRTILLDVEGTTTSLHFVYEILFSYARRRLRGFLEQHVSSPEVAATLDALSEEHIADVCMRLNPPPLHDETRQARVNSAAAYIEWLMARDRKSVPLKSLQGKIWEEGYHSGQLRGEIFEDVPRALRRWRRQEREVCIFSSGSVLAQKLLFANTKSGDLTACISHFFDTKTGTKTNTDSYLNIAGILRRLPSEMAFISDTSPELDAAKAARLQTFRCERPGNHPQPENSHRSIRSLDEVFP